MISNHFYMHRIASNRLEYVQKITYHQQLTSIDQNRIDGRIQIHVCVWWLTKIFHAHKIRNPSFHACIAIIYDTCWEAKRHGLYGPSHDLYRVSLWACHNRISSARSVFLFNLNSCFSANNSIFSARFAFHFAWHGCSHSHIYHITMLLNYINIFCLDWMVHV